uniref:GON-4-like protein n=1 Tax=Bursaphelenchus xylophilus TaxID=6326 RepID=A0A1I7SE09_BURXY
MDDDQQPCSSRDMTAEKEKRKEETVILDKNLSDCAKKYNLSKMNVKDIIQSICKDPNILASLLKEDPDALENLRLTRSRLKELETSTQLKFEFLKFKPLDVRPEEWVDDEEEESSDDYQPEGEDDDDEDFNDEEEEDGVEEEANEESNDVEAEDVQALESTANGAFYFDVDPMLISTKPPEYVDFLKGCFKETESNDAEEEDMDPDFDENFLNEDDDFFERYGRTSRIPEDEVDLLYRDAYDESDVTLMDLDVPLAITPCKDMMTEEERTESNTHSSPIRPLSRTKITTPKPSPKAVLPKTKKPPIVIKDSSKKSWSLLKRHSELAQFTAEEIQALKVQFEQHLQLITQVALLTKDEPRFVKQRNTSMRMLYELDQKQLSAPPNSIYLQVSNIESAINSVNEIETFDENLYDKSLCSQIRDKLAMTQFNLPSTLVLANSLAIKFPNLLPQNGPQTKPNCSSSGHFLPSEQFLLALAIFEMAHVPHSTGGSSQKVSKYQQISDSFLPNKTSTQIRNYMKNIRIGTLKNPLHQMAVNAENGIWNVEFVFDNGENARTDRPLDWPMEVKNTPYWLRPKFSVLATAKSEGHLDPTIELNFYICDLGDKSPLDPKFAAPEYTHLTPLLEEQSIEEPAKVDGVDFQSVLCFIYTSGTTGMPKAAVMRGLRFMAQIKAKFAVVGWKLPQAMVLANSKALKFPDLLPVHLPRRHPQSGVFLPSEKMLLSLGLYALNHYPEPKKSEFNFKNKYLIDLFLPNKYMNSINSTINHARNMKIEERSIYEDLLLMAMEGKWLGKVEFKHGTPKRDPPVCWDNITVPHWLKLMQKYRKTAEGTREQQKTPTISSAICLGSPEIQKMAEDLAGSGRNRENGGKIFVLEQDSDQTAAGNLGITREIGAPPIGGPKIISIGNTPQSSGNPIVLVDNTATPINFTTPITSPPNVIAIPQMTTQSVLVQMPDGTFQLTQIPVILQENLGIIISQNEAQSVPAAVQALQTIDLTPMRSNQQVISRRNSDLPSTSKAAQIVGQIEHETPRNGDEEEIIGITEKQQEEVVDVVGIDETVIPEDEGEDNFPSKGPKRHVTWNDQDPQSTTKRPKHAIDLQEKRDDGKTPQGKKVSQLVEKVQDAGRGNAECENPQNRKENVLEGEGSGDFREEGISDITHDDHDEVLENSGCFNSPSSLKKSVEDASTSKKVSSSPPVKRMTGKGPLEKGGRTDEIPADGNEDGPRRSSKLPTIIRKRPEAVKAFSYSSPAKNVKRRLFEDPMEKVAKIPKNSAEISTNLVSNRSTNNRESDSPEEGEILDDSEQEFSNLSCTRPTGNDQEEDQVLCHREESNMSATMHSETSRMAAEIELRLESDKEQIPSTSKDFSKPLPKIGQKIGENGQNSGSQVDNNVFYAKPFGVWSKKPRRPEQIERCMRGFNDPKIVTTWCRLALECVKRVARRKLFMHRGRTKEFIAVMKENINAGEVKIKKK